MKREIQDEGLRILTGLFGDTATQMAQLCTEWGAVGTTPICQLWRTERLGLITYPSYFFLFGRCNKVTVPQSRETPKLRDSKLREPMILVDRIPEWHSTPAETELNLGRCKQMLVEVHTWHPGVHQLTMSIGTARTGQGAKTRSRHVLAA